MLECRRGIESYLYFQVHVTLYLDWLLNEVLSQICTISNMITSIRFTLCKVITIVSWKITIYLIILLILLSWLLHNSKGGLFNASRIIVVTTCDSFNNWLLIRVVLDHFSILAIIVITIYLGHLVWEFTQIHLNFLIVSSKEVRWEVLLLYDIICIDFLFLYLFHYLDHDIIKINSSSTAQTALNKTTRY